jgi:hypothetical protein
MPYRTPAEELADKKSKERDPGLKAAKGRISERWYARGLVKKPKLNRGPAALPNSQLDKAKF